MYLHTFMFMIVYFTVMFTITSVFVVIFIYTNSWKETYRAHIFIFKYLSILIIFAAIYVRGWKVQPKKVKV